MTDSKCKCKSDGKNTNEEKVCEVENEVEVVEEEKHKAHIIPEVAKYKRPPAFEKWNSFARWNQNSCKPVLRRAAQRWR